MSRAWSVVALALALAGCSPGDDAPGSTGTSGASSAIPIPSFRDVDPDVVRAVEVARAEVEAHPESSDAWGALADRYAVHQFLPEAIECYARAEALDPDGYVWSYRLGWMRFMNGTGDAAAPIARALESLGESYAPAHEAYGQVLMRAGRDEEAVAQFELASRLDPTNAHAAAGLGVIALRRGDEDAALAHFDDAVRRDPRHGEAHIALARLYAKRGRTDDAREHAEISRDLPQISPRNDLLVSPMVEAAGSTARTSYGMVLERQGDLAGAEEQYRTALESNAHAAQARRRLAMLMEKDGRRDEAIALLQEAEDTGAATVQTTELLEKYLKRKTRRDNRAADVGDDDAVDDDE